MSDQDKECETESSERRDGSSQPYCVEVKDEPSLEIVEDGDIWTVTDGLVLIPINTVGAMGVGLALAFRERYPEIYVDYRKRCKRGEWGINTLRMYCVTETLSFLLIPTKQHWKNYRRLDIVEANIKKLGSCLERCPHDTLHVPPLGCGAGGLSITTVRELVAEHLVHPTITTYFYQPYGA